jgi:gliding motility-associated-like protein
LVQVFSLPVAEFNPNPSSATELDPTIAFNNLSSTDVIYWNWDFGDGNLLAPGPASPEHYYPDSVSGNYLVTLIVRNAGGCYSTVKHEIFIEPGFTFYIPNSFSPNGNGVNDYFFGSGVGIIKYDLQIFDRWGNLIFHTTELTGKWDGKSSNGKDKLQIDLYVWKVELTDLYNKKHNYIGTVTLMK